MERKATFWVGTLIAVLAGAWTIFHLIWNFAAQTADDYWGVALLILLALALILSFVQYAQERAALTADARSERFPEPAISRFFLDSEGSSVLWFVVRGYDEKLVEEIQPLPSNYHLNIPCLCFTCIDS